LTTQIDAAALTRNSRAMVGSAVFAIDPSRTAMTVPTATTTTASQRRSGGIPAGACWAIAMRPYANACSA
jgi:hypothetical protein